jgi:hypothetical protein
VAWKACQLDAVLLLVCNLTVLGDCQNYIDIRVLLALPQAVEGQRHQIERSQKVYPQRCRNLLAEQDSQVKANRVVKHIVLNQGIKVGGKLESWLETVVTSQLRVKSSPSTMVRSNCWCSRTHQAG